ncbi:MAG: hypothetical protein LUG18_12005 [Candidatus Azobacteroides sp.]|nr:hypothetical protein [Candidatus Azobacteroides sp.]
MINYSGHKIAFSAVFCFVFLCVLAQNSQPTSPAGANTEKSQIILEYADILSSNKELNPDIEILIGNVRFRHENTLMDCDSAYFYKLSNSLDAFGNVEMNQADTLFAYGNVLYYDGNTKLARLRENVRMENRGVTLFTDSLNYDRVANISYYFEGGVIIDQDNELSSVYGQYSPATKIAVFNYDVQLINPRFILYSDTLRYDTNTGIATILGPSRIVSDSSTIYCTRGWYNTRTDESELLDRPIVETSSKKTLTGDTLKYNRQIGIGEAFGNIELQDTAQKILLRGEYGYHNELTDYSFVTKKALAIEYSGVDSLFLHADTLKTMPDSTFNILKAYHNVRFFREDFQGVCDSMQYSTRDSILRLFTHPVLWNELYQIYGDTILLYMKDGAPDYAHVQEFAFAVSQKDTLEHYDQVTGLDMKIWFQEGQIKKVTVSGNAESIYYPEESDLTIIGLNRTLSGFLDIYLVDKKIDKLVIYPTPEGSLTPLGQIISEDLYLKNFVWFDYLRPKDKQDIFRNVERNEDTPVYKTRRFRY